MAGDEPELQTRHECYMDGKKDEREAIVAWFRGLAVKAEDTKHYNLATTLRKTAAAIERGDHHHAA